jgi:hypothetical protein
VTTNLNTTRRVITMPFAWKVFGFVCLLAILVELSWLREPNSGYVYKLIILTIIVITLVAGVELLFFRLILDDAQMSMRRWPGVGFVRNYSDILDIRVRGQRARIVIFRPEVSAMDPHKKFRAKIPASAIKPAELCDFLNRKISDLK